MAKKRRVFLQQAAVVTCAGNSLLETYQSALEGRVSLFPCDYFSSEIFSHTPYLGLLDSSYAFEVHLERALHSLGDSREWAHDSFLVVGSSVGGMLATEQKVLNGKTLASINFFRHSIGGLGRTLHARYGFRDHVSLSTACTSSANALVFAHRLLTSGACERVVVAGVDSISHTTVLGFSSLGVLSAEPCRPFDVLRSGMNVAEGIALLVLGVEPLAGSVEFCGYGVSSDAYSIPHPHPEGKGAELAMRGALTMGGVDASAVGYINAHGTATKANDAAEALAIERVFGRSTLVGSTKSTTGHALGAAGAIEAALCMQIFQARVIPANLRLERPEAPLAFVRENTHSPELRYLLSNSFAFGGNNVSILLGGIV